MKLKWNVGHSEHEQLGNDGRMFNHILTMTVDTTRKLTEDEWRLVESRATLAAAGALNELSAMEEDSND